MPNPPKKTAFVLNKTPGAESTQHRPFTVLSSSSPHDLGSQRALLTWAVLHTGGPKAVLPIGVWNQQVEVGVVAHEAGAGVLTHPVVLEVPAGLRHKQQSSKQSPPSNDNTTFL